MLGTVLGAFSQDLLNEGLLSLLTHELLDIQKLAFQPVPGIAAPTGTPVATQDKYTADP